MILLDSNIIIYVANYRPAKLVAQLSQHALQVSAITKLETLGYHLLSKEAKITLLTFFESAEILPINDRVLSKAITLRQDRRMSLANSLIAATALTYDVVLWTNNTKDFKNIPGLNLFNPIS